MPDSQIEGVCPKQLNEVELSGKRKQGTANIVFIKLWRDVKHSAVNHYFAFVVN